MRVMSVNSFNHLQRQTKLSRQNKKISPEQNLQNADINFKGKKWAVLQSAVWAGLGFIAAGPVGAIAGAAIGAGIGSKLDDDEPAGDDDNRPYNP